MKKLIPLLFIALLFASCSWDGKFKRVKVENEYSLDIPTFLSESNMLNDMASLQYQDIYRDFYVIVLDERKSELRSALQLGGLSNSDGYSNDLEGYANLMINSYSIMLNMKKSPDILDGEVNQLPAKFVSIEGEFEGEEVFWKVAFIEGPYKYYQVYTWSKASNKEEHKITMNQILKSFKEL